MNLKQVVVVATVLFFSTSALVNGNQVMTTQEIRDEYKKHAAMAQLNRWYLIYEESRYGIDNHLDILAEDIQVKSGLGEANGHNEYKERVQSLPDTWLNAHDVKNKSAILNEDGSLSAEITYTNKGFLENGEIRSAELTYAMALIPSGTVLPKFSRIEIGQNSDGRAVEFVPRYGQNRILSLVHYWLALIEDPARDPEPVREILGENFSLNFSSGAISRFDDFKVWLAGPASQGAASTHQISNFSQKQIEEDNYTVEMDFDWNGILPDGTEMVAKTRHNWIVFDDPMERFPRIVSVDVEILEPFAPKNN